VLRSASPTQSTPSGLVCLVDGPEEEFRRFIELLKLGYAAETSEILVQAQVPLECIVSLLAPDAAS